MMIVTGGLLEILSGLSGFPIEDIRPSDNLDRFHHGDVSQIQWHLQALGVYVDELAIQQCRMVGELDKLCAGYRRGRAATSPD